MKVIPDKCLNLISTVFFLVFFFKYNAFHVNVSHRDAFLIVHIERKIVFKIIITIHLIITHISHEIDIFILFYAKSRTVVFCK